MFNPGADPPVEAKTAGLGHRLRRLYLQSGLYARRLAEAPAIVLNTRLTPFWPGDSDHGNQIFQGRYRFTGREARAPNTPPWRLRAADPGWMTGLHGFDWLADFAAVGADASRQHAVKLIRSWIDLCLDLDPLIWSPALTARRLMNWVAWWDFLCGDSIDQRFQAAFEFSLGRHLIHLRATAHLAPDGWARLSTIMAETALTLAADQMRGELDAVLVRLDAALDEQIMADGVHITRSPAVQLRLVGELALLSRLAAAINRESLSAKLQIRARQLAGFVAQLRHGDGKLALFNGAYEGDARAISHILDSFDEAVSAPLTTAQAGFQRLGGGASLLLVDGGLPQPLETGLAPYAGAGSFEFSIGADRLVVNCGSGMGRLADWQTAARRGLAHSVLTLDGQAAGAAAATGRERGAGSKLNCRRHENEDDSVWIEISHDGFAKSHQLLHQRRIYLQGGGDDLRGEDQLVRLNTSAGPERNDPVFRLAFHLHPDVDASQVQGGAVLLRLPSGAGWRFLADGGEIKLEESVYLGDPHEARRSQQITLNGRANPEAKLRWAFRRLQ